MRLRKAALTVHVTASVGWVGAVAAFLALAVPGVSSTDPATVRACYLAMDVITTGVIVPLAVAALLSGVLSSLVSPWGLLRHYWVVVKLLLTTVATVVLLLQLAPIGRLADAATQAPISATELHEARVSAVVHAGGGLAVLLVTTVLAVYKPPGMTSYGWRRRQQQRRIPAWLTPPRRVAPQPRAMSAGPYVPGRRPKTRTVAPMCSSPHRVTASRCSRLTQPCEPIVAS
jgi:hypothetical protein